MHMTQTIDGLLERIAAIRPILEKNASQTESDRRVVDENIAALKEVGAFKIMVPQRYGGWQADIRTQLEVSREVAKGCGSTAWVTALMNVCSFFVGLMNEQAQNDVWGTNPEARIAGVFNPTAQTRKVDGGIIVTGAWNWASGSYHADWSYVGVPITNDEGEFLYPAYSEYELQRDAPTFQLAISKAATLVDTAHLFAYRAAADIDDAAKAGRALTYVERARTRNDTGHAAESAREGIRVLCSAHGASSFAEASPMQRIWRDSEIASRHAVVAPEISSLIYGRALMGFTEGVSFLV
jgi:alkylation response protein AidB-like acyl-CoA dehydrogenase